MEILTMPYLLPLLLLPLSLCLIFFIRKRGSGHPTNLPPGSEGWPILGENMELAMLGSQQLVRNKMQKYSRDVFKTSLLGEKVAVLCGAKGNKFIYTNQNTLFNRWAPLSLRRALYQDLDVKSHQEPKATFQNFQYDILKPDSLKRYVPVMDSLAREQLEQSWNPASVVKVLPLTKTYAFELACRVFMNVADSERLGRLLEPFSLLAKGILSLPINLPGTALNRAIRGCKVVRGELKRVVEERRKEMMMMKGSRGDDLLSKMVVATNEDGEYMSDNMIVNVIVGLLISAEYELSSTITIVIYYLAELPHIYDEVLKGKS